MKKPSLSNTNANNKVLFDIASILSATVSPNHPNLETVTTYQYTYYQECFHIFYS